MTPQVYTDKGIAEFEEKTNLPLRVAVRAHCGHHAWCSRGTLGVYRYRGGYTHGTVRSEESAERAFPPFARALCADDLMCCCRRSSCW